MSDFDGERLPTEDSLLFVDFAEVTLKRKIGEGFFGEVYKGSFRGSTVAVKMSVEEREERDERKFILPLFLSALNSLRKRTEESHIIFTEEVQILKSLHHPNLVLLIAAAITAPNEAIVSRLHFIFLCVHCLCFSRR
jgi:serine/threonine protein kinase